MRKFIFTFIGIILASVTLCSIDWHTLGATLTFPFLENESSKDEAHMAEYMENSISESDEIWIDTVMYAGGHAFGYSGDVSMWGGWYFDTIHVGDDRMLTYDSVGPSTLKLSLVTRNLIVDLRDSDAAAKIRAFMQPIKGFLRFQRNYEKCLDTIVFEETTLFERDTMEYMGEFTFTVDYPDSCIENREAINRFICNLTGISKSEKAKVPGLSAFYAGFNPTKNYRPVFTGDANDIQCLSDFMAHKTFENWIRGGELDMGSSGSVLALCSHIANNKFVTYGKYEYERVGTGHGMYTETFHTLDIKRGKELTNKDIFKAKSLDGVKKELFEVMAKDLHYLAWNDGLDEPGEIENRIVEWQSPNPILEGTEWEEPDREAKFELPDGALTNSGVVFSFQPYEIDCWAAGSFHFIVPYKKLMPYLTAETKKLIRACNSKKN